MTEEVNLQLELDDQRKKVDVDNVDVTLREIVRMAYANELIRKPPYQRKFRWEPHDESRLIESFYLGLPVPNIFVASNKDGTWELVDGLQRVSTLMHYVADPIGMVAAVGKKDPLRLDGLEKLSTFKGKTFADLPTPVRLSFLKRTLRVTALSDKSDLDVRFDMFERLNSGGIVLTQQEIRSCIHAGRFIDFLKELGADSNFASLLKLPKAKQDDGTKEELVLRFFAYLYDRNKFTASVKDFLNNYVEKAKAGFDYQEGKPLFENVTRTLMQIVGGVIVRSNGKVTPLNQFESIMVACAELLKDGKKIKKPRPGWMDDESLLSYSSAGTKRPRKNNLNNFYLRGNSV